MSLEGQSHPWLRITGQVATVLDSADIEHFHYHRQYCSRIIPSTVWCGTFYRLNLLSFRGITVVIQFKALGN